MNGWDDVRERVAAAITKDDMRSQSINNSLNKIINEAERMEITSGFAEQASISNLVEIISEAKKAVKKKRKERLEELFKWAKELSNKDLRIKLRGDNREEIPVQQITGRYGPTYLFEVSQEQFDRIKNATKLSFEFHIKEVKLL